MWMMPLHLHVNQTSDYDMMMMTKAQKGLAGRTALPCLLLYLHQLSVDQGGDKLLEYHRTSDE